MKIGPLLNPGQAKIDADSFRRDDMDHRFSSFDELSPGLQARLRRLANRKASWASLWLSGEEVEELRAVLGESTSHLRVPSKGRKHGRQVCFGFGGHHERLAWVS